jgi:hypothetical protein
MHVPFCSPAMCVCVMSHVCSLCVLARPSQHSPAATPLPWLVVLVPPVKRTVLWRYHLPRMQPQVVFCC